MTDLTGLHALLPPGAGVVCAVSGGADSVCLLHLLRSLAPELGLRLRAAHYNHQLRGAEADEDEAFVQTLCRQWDVPLVTGRGDVAALAKASGQGIEAAARQARYAFLLEAAGSDLIATAHTADDNAETMLINLVRGSALTGLAGIPAKSGQIVRPLLRWTRQDVLDYLARNGLSHREDSSNAEDAYLRNRIRHQVLPLLQQENPSLVPAMDRLAQQIRQDDAYLDACAARALADLRTRRGLNCAVLPELPEALQGRVVLQWLKDVSGLTHAHVDAVLALAASQHPSGQFSLPGGWVVRREYAQLVLEKSDAFTEILPEVLLAVPGVTQWGDWRIRTVFDTPDPTLDPAHTLALDYDLLALPLVVRPRRTGDRILLPGGEKQLKKLMIDLKLPAASRARLPVIADRNGPVALETGSALLGRTRHAGRQLYLQITGV